MTKSECAARAANFANMQLCGAKARHNKHKPCRQPAMPNGRCRLHGGKSTGPKTPEGKLKAARANLKHGHYTKEAIASRRESRELLRESWDDLEMVKSLHAQMNTNTDNGQGSKPKV